MHGVGNHLYRLNRYVQPKRIRFLAPLAGQKLRFLPFGFKILKGFAHSGTGVYSTRNYSSLEFCSGLK